MSSSSATEPGGVPCRTTDADNRVRYEAAPSRPTTPPEPAASIPARLDWPRGQAPHVRAAGRCRPSRDGVSGDVIDVFPTPPGEWGAVVGDVCGNGARAAEMAARARRTLRLMAGHALTAPDILGGLNRAILSDERNGERFLTAVYVGLAVTSEGVSATVCSAGHPPALVARSDGTVHQLGTGGIALGVIADPPLAERRIILQSGDTMLLYTDGVTEARRDGECYGDVRLQRLLSQVGRCEPATVAELVEGAALKFSHPAGCYDIAVLVLRVG